MSFELTIVEGEGRGWRIPLEAAGVSIGRDGVNDVIVADAGVSRRHARLRRSGTGWVLVDLGSANGTELNGVPVAAPVALRDGDRIGIGPVVFAFRACAGIASDPGGEAAPVVRGGAGNPARLARAVAALGRRLPRSPRARAGVAFGALFLLGLLAWVAALSRAPRTSAGPAVIAVAPSGRNVLSFAPAQPGKERSVARVRIEPIPEAPADPRVAREAYERGRRKLEERNVAPRNLYDAWSSFVQARRALGTDEPRSPLYAEVSQRIAEVERDLQKECARLLFGASRHQKYGQDEKAQRVFREVLQHFPAGDPWDCRKRAQDHLTDAQDATPASD